MKLHFAILAVALLAANALAQQRIVPEQSDISFTSKQVRRFNQCFTKCAETIKLIVGLLVNQETVYIMAFK